MVRPEESQSLLLNFAAASASAQVELNSGSVVILVRET